ncbi:MAG: hypothetical protein ABW221_25805 [Vicinamibacteria bacterium]
MIAAALLLPAAAGALLFTFAWDRTSSLGARVAAAVPIATALQGLLGYVLAGWFGMHAWTGAAVALALLAAGAGAAGREGIARLRRAAAACVPALRAVLRGPARTLVVGVLYVALGGALLAAVFDRAIVATPGGAIATGVDHNLGDLPFHLAIVSGFVRGQNFPPEHPELAGVRLTYPFGVDLAAGLAVAAGASAREAFLVQNLALAFACAFLLWRFALRVTGDGRAALLTPPLVLLSGGLGWFWFLRDVRDRPEGLLDLLMRLPRDYTMLEAAGIRWGNALTTLLVPQRAFLLGLPLFLVVLTLWWDALGEPDERAARRLMLGAGAVAGLLPLAHAHGFVVVGSVAALLALVFRRFGLWARFALAAGGLALPQIAWMAHGSSTAGGRFVGWHLGWDHGTTNPLVAWTLDAGVFLFLWVLALVARRRLGLRAGAVRFLAPFALWFVVPNVLRLSPWIWDNVKFLFYWYVATAPLVAAALSWISRRGRLGPPAAAVLLLASVAAGGLDAWRYASRSRLHVLFDRDALAIADAIARTTPPRALVLHYPTFNAPVLLSGRRSLLGYPGHIWSQGLDASNRLARIQAVYAGTLDPASLSLPRADYLLEGPQERQLDLNGPALQRFPVVAEHGPYRLRRVVR